MRFLYSIIIFLLFAEHCISQEISVIDSSSDEPVYNVNVISINLNGSTATNKEGKFNLSHFSQNDSLKFSHISYKAKTLSFREVLLSKKVFLVPTFIEQEEVEITEKKYEYSGITLKEKIEIDENLKGTYTNLGDILKASSSIFIKDYGGFSGIKTISSRGMSSENTIVLFNEARVNDLQTGVFDLSSISSISLERIEFQKSFDDESSYSSAGGVLKIFTADKFQGRKINSVLRLSSDNYRSAFIQYSDGNENIFFNINGERNYSPNHFEYIFEDKKLKRENAHFNKSFISGDLTVKSNDFHLNLYSNYSYLNSGIPGFVVTNNFNSSRATNKSSKNLSILNSKYSFNNFFDLNGILSYNKQSLLLNDPDGFLVNTNDNKESNLSDFSAMLRGDLTFDRLQINFGNEFNSSSLENFTSFVSSNIIPDKMDRISDKIFSNLKTNFINPLEFINNLAVFGKINYEITEENIGRKIKTSNFTYDFGLSIIPAVDPFINIKSHYGNNVRFPTFNERYYSSLYNHYELNAEEYKVLDAGVDLFFNLFGENSFSAAYFYVDGNNKIIWIPTRLALQTPRNISKVNTTGVELNFNKKLFEENLEVSLFYVYTNAKNKSKISENDLSYNKQLIYTPLHRFNFNISTKVNPFSFSVYSSFVGERFYTTDNNINYLLPDYYVIDFSASYNFALLSRSHSISLAIYNLFNENYFIIQSYPMPLRTFLLTLNMELL